jgi:hypothetical protein
MWVRPGTGPGGRDELAKLRFSRRHFSPGDAQVRARCETRLSHKHMIES